MNNAVRSRMTRSTGPDMSVLAAACLLGAVAPCGLGQDDPPPDTPPDTTREVPYTIRDAADAARTGGDGERSPLDVLGENLRLNIDVVSRVEYASRRGEFAFMNAIGIDARKVISGDSGDFGTLYLQPYIVRWDNRYDRFVNFGGDDAFTIELHDFYLNVTQWGRGRTNFKVGHFDVPFGIEPLVDTHFTLQQYIPLHDAGFKKDWGGSLNGSMPEFDYEISLTTGTGMELNDLDRDPYLVAGRIGTPADQNFVIGVSSFYGEVIDEHGGHRHDEADPSGEEPREEVGVIRRWRVGVDVTQIVEQYTLRAELSAGEDFSQAVANAIAEVSWTTPDERFGAYVQGVYLGQNGHLGWDEDVQSRVGFRWRLTESLTFSAAWTHEFETWAEELGDEHLNEDTIRMQLRMRF